jgi:cytochrome P450/ferredoxin
MEGASVSEPALDLLSPSAFSDGFPHEAFRALRGKRAVFRHPEPDGPGFWVVSRHEDVKAVSKDPGTFSSSAGTSISDLQPIDAGTPNLVQLDPPEHGRLRSALRGGGFESLEPALRKSASAALDAAEGKGAFDFVADVAGPMAAAGISEWLGVPERDRRPLQDLVQRLFESDEPDSRVSQGDWRKATGDLCRFAARSPGFLTGRPGLSSEQVHSLFIAVAIPGMETGRASLAHAAKLLLEHPEQAARLLAEPGLLVGAVEEILRFEPPISYFRRTATRDIELGGARILRGDKVTIWYPPANRDEAVFRDPDRFDIGRSPNEHLAFGIGEHYCWGAGLARLELKVLLQELGPRLGKLSQAGPPARLKSNFQNALKSLPLKAGRWTLSIDPELCEGNALCRAEAPELFEVDSKDRGRVRTLQPDDALRARAEAAARRCPRQAIRVS